MLDATIGTEQGVKRQQRIAVVTSLFGFSEQFGVSFPSAIDTSGANSHRLQIRQVIYLQKSIQDTNQNSTVILQNSKNELDRKWVNNDYQLGHWGRGDPWGSLRTRGIGAAQRL